MIKRLIAVLMAFFLLLGLFGCKTTVEDTRSTGMIYGNTLATEQGDWIAMRGEEDGKVGVLLYNKKRNKSEFLLEADAYHIAMLGNKIYFKYLQGSELYCYDIEREEYQELLSGVMAYQVYQNMLYFLTDEHGAWLNTYDLITGKIGKMELNLTADAFWITDYALYYHDDARDMLLVRPHDTSSDAVLRRGFSEHCRDVVSLNGGADVAFLVMPDSAEKATVYTYDAEIHEFKEHLTGTFTHMNIVNNRIVVVEGNTIVSIDYVNNQNYDWGTLEDYDYPQIMSGCVILYDGNKPVIQYYPESE